MGSARREAATESAAKGIRSDPKKNDEWSGQVCEYKVTSDGRVKVGVWYSANDVVQCRLCGDTKKTRKELDKVLVESDAEITRDTNGLQGSIFQKVSVRIVLPWKVCCL